MVKPPLASYRLCIAAKFAVPEYIICATSKVTVSAPAPNKLQHVRCCEVLSKLAVRQPMPTNIEFDSWGLNQGALAESSTQDCAGAGKAVVNREPWIPSHRGLAERSRRVARRRFRKSTLSTP